MTQRLGMPAVISYEGDMRLPEYFKKMEEMHRCIN